MGFLFEPQLDLMGEGRRLKPWAKTGLMFLLSNLLTVLLLVIAAKFEGSDAQAALYFAIVVLVGVNFIIEFGANLILSPAISSIVKAFQKMK